MRRMSAKRAVNLAAAVITTGVVVFVGALGAGPVPSVAPLLDPVHGVWTGASDAAPPRSQTLRIAGLARPVQVLFEADGVAHIQARSDADLFAAMGYVHARFRLQQMDLLRRQGEGRLSEVVGPDALAGDRFELELGLTRTAATEWAQAGAETRGFLEDYAHGVNAWLAETRRTGEWPLVFRLLGYQPRDWTPLDSLAIQGVLAQTLGFQDSPVTYGLLTAALGADRTMSWLPVLPPNGQQPYAPGPYTAQPPASLMAGTTPVDPALLALHDTLAQLPPWAIARGGDSNAWAVDGTRTATGRPLLAGDPHLGLTLPAIWYQVGADSPGFHFEGVGIPGAPGIVIGRNEHVAWSLTDTQNQQTFYYQEVTNASGQYLWDGQWRSPSVVHYDIPVKGRASERLDVPVTVHGPILEQQGHTYAVSWTGDLPSQDITVLLRIVRASDHQTFRDALRDWRAPTLNFVYADDGGHIGQVSAGLYPIVADGQPWLPLPGTGTSDIAGTIPFDAIPQVVDPAGHVVFSANNRVVGPDFPYYVGPLVGGFDPGYRADEIHAALSAPRPLTLADMTALQTDDRDFLAAEIAPSLVQALGGARLSPAEEGARRQLAGWDGRMSAAEAAPSIWSAFWQSYLEATFQPWWTALHVPVPLSDLADPLTATLEAWTMGDPRNAAFTPPGGARRDAAATMVTAFRGAVADLGRRLGPDPATWRWGRMHQREIPSLFGFPGLGFGPVASDGDRYSPDAASGAVSTFGPSWRFVVDFGTGATLGVYPGGQSEDAASAWYRDGVEPWLQGRYRPVRSWDDAAGQPGSVRWRLEP
jgi:penicillin G amidase